ncbi:uncharacterized protein [Antedon mediterranea]|uniref:uncharacterized protein n=1 Tax=Antedon mediterranea TaxID=105859 RepID=UPI003AF5523B
MERTVYEEETYVGLVVRESKISVNSSLEQDDNQLDFDLKIIAENTGDMLIIASYSNNTMGENEAVNESVDISNLFKANIAFRYFNGMVFSCSVYDFYDQMPLEAKIEFTMTKRISSSVTNKDKWEMFCVFLDETRSTWSDAGMVTTSYSLDQVSCYSEHLTSFSVLMKVTTDNVSVENSETLSLMSTVCV